MINVDLSTDLMSKIFEKNNSEIYIVLNIRYIQRTKMACCNELNLMSYYVNQILYLKSMLLKNKTTYNKDYI